MGRFISNGMLYAKDTMLINTDYIVAVRGIDQNRLELTMHDGRTIITSAFLMDEISGRSVIRQVVPVRNVVAHFSPTGADDYQLPVYALGITENGEVRPLDLEEDFVDFMDRFTGFTGITINGKEIGGE